MKDWKQFLITFFTLAITFIIPVTLTQVIQNNPQDLRTKAQEITAQAASTVNTSIDNLSDTPTIEIPVLGEMTIATLALYILAFIFLVITIVSGINLVKSSKKTF